MIDQLVENDRAIIKVIGIGGGGGNAVEYMVTNHIEGVEFVSMNTDAQVLKSSKATTKLQIGNELTKGLGAGADPNVGRQAALEDEENIRQILTGADMVFITAGMGGGTGTGAAPEVARMAKELGILTVAVVTRPFPFEGNKRSDFAGQGIDELAKYCDSLITIPNEKLLKVMGKGTPLLQAFSAANDVLRGAVQGISEIITRQGLVNVDFADVRTVMSEMGVAMMGTGVGRGEDRAEEAANAAIACPLLEDIDLTGARGILVNITAGYDFAVDEIDTIGNAVKAFASDNATVVVGAVLDPDITDEIRVTVVATGIGNDKPAMTLVTPMREAVNASPRMSQGAGHQRADAPVRSADDSKFLDIPAFIRKQAD